MQVTATVRYVVLICAVVASIGCGAGSSATPRTDASDPIQKKSAAAQFPADHRYQLKLIDGRFGYVSSEQPAHIKTMSNGYRYFSFRGKGYENLYKARYVSSLVDVRSGADVAFSPMSPNVCNPSIGCGSGPCYDGDSCLPRVPSWVDLVAAGCDPNFTRCGDDGAGTATGSGLIIKIPGQYYCFWDFSSDVPDCYYDQSVNGASQNGQNLFRSWMRQNGSVGILCNATGLNGRAYALYIDNLGAGIAAKGFQPKNLTAFFYPKDWGSSLTPGPSATINVNFFQYGIPIDAYNIGYCDHTG